MTTNRMNIGFLFLTYDDIIHDETKRFVKDYSVYVNAKNPQKILENNNYIISNHPTDWGKKNIVDATIQMLENAYQAGHNWFVLLAYDALPLTSPNELESFLKYQTKSLFHLISNNDTVWKTSQWWILSRADVQTILEHTDEYNNYLLGNPYNDNDNVEIKGAWDELYFLSLLKYVDPAYVFREYKTTFVKWLTKSIQKHPVTYGKLLLTDIEESKKSFFIRKTTPELKSTLYKPNKKLCIKIFGTKSKKTFNVPTNIDLILISMVKNDEIPEKILNTSIHTYYSISKFIHDTVLEVLDTIPTYMWETIYVLDENSNRISVASVSNQKVTLNLGYTSLPNPPQFYEHGHGCYKYSPNKIAFLFLTIGDINQPNIWTKYLENKQDKYSVYINSKHPETIKTPWLKDKVIPNNVVNTGWGKITEAYHNLLEEAMKDEDNVKFVFISESCIPLKSFDEFYEKMMTDDIRTSYVKFMTPSLYDKRERIEKIDGYKQYIPFIKHYARMCLSRYHVEKLLEKDFSFFNNMPISDEFFLTLIHLKPNVDFVKNFEITYDNWEDINKKNSELTEQIEELKKRTNNRSMNMLRRKRAIRNSIRKNPVTYTKITTHDIERALSKESFFWRKFTNEPLPWTPEILNISSTSQRQTSQPQTNQPRQTKKKSFNTKTKTRKGTNI
jgi:Core-2/I-Branching enzyme